MKALDTAIVGDYKLKLIDVERLAEKITHKVNVIIMLLHQIFDTAQPITWHYENDSLYAEDLMDLSSDNIYFSATYIGFRDRHDMHTDDYSYNSQFPYDFLFKSSDEIKKIVEAQIVGKERKQAERIKEDRRIVVKTDKIRREALRKLTDQEKTVLGYG